MINSLIGLIAQYDMGMIINVSEGLDLFWYGQRIQIHSMIENEHVWVEQNATLDRFVIGFGECPSQQEWLTAKEAKQLLLAHFGW